MSIAFEVCRALSILCFLVYGVLCVTGRSMVAEFERFGLARFRVMVGVLEVLGSLGLMASYRFPALVPVAAGGLTVLMLLGVLTRLRVGDYAAQIAPAFILMLVNGFVALTAIL